MQTAVEHLGDLSRRLVVTVPSQQIEGEINRRIQEMAKKVHIKGFRPGKVPIGVIKTRFGEDIRQEAMDSIIWTTLPDALKENDLHPVGLKVEPPSMKEGEPFQYSVTFEVYPDIKMANVDKMKVKKPLVNVTEADLNEMLEKLREQNAKWEPVDRAAQKGDSVVIDFEGFKEGKPFEGGSAKNYKLTLGKGEMIPGFEEGIIGAKLHDSITLNVTFPENYPSKELAGQPAQFNVKLNEVLEARLPELNDALAKDLGADEGTLEGLRKEVETAMQRELKQRIQAQLKSQIVKQLFDQHEVTIPLGLIDNEVERLQENFQKQWEAQTGKKNPSPLPREHFEEQARRNVVLGLLLSQYIKDHQLTPDATRVREKIEGYASNYHHPQEIINWYYSHKEKLAEIEAVVLEEQAFEKMLEQVSIEEEPMDYKTFMNSPISEE